jgi:hypothetical protein
MGIRSGNHEVDASGIPRRGSDPRTFQHYAKLDAQGNVIAIVEVAETEIKLGSPDEWTDDQRRVYVNVTRLYPYQLDGAKVPPKMVTDRDFAAARAVLQAHSAARQG